MKPCAKEHFEKKKSCNKCECRSWIKYEEDLNCTDVALKKNGCMTLKEVAKRLGVSYVRITQIEKTALSKLRKKVFTKDKTNYNNE